MFLKCKIALFLLLIVPCRFLSALEKFQLANISIKDGLSNLNVNAITQDQLGYIWVATMRGLNRYNGYEFRHYFFDPNDSNSLRSNHIFSLLQSKEGQLYIGSMTGIDYYDVRNDRIESPFPDFNKTVLAFTEYGGFVYVGTTDGLYRFRPGSGTVESLDNSASGSFYVNCLFPDSSGNIWCGLDNGGGLVAFNIQSGRFDHYFNNTKQNQLNYNIIRTICRISENIIALGTKQGICFFDLDKRQFTGQHDFSLLSEELHGFDVRFILEKEPSVYWIGTYQGGLFTFSKSANKVVRHYYGDNNSEIHSSSFMCQYVDKTGNVWLGTFNTGLDVSFNQALNFNYDVSLNKLTQGKFITGITKDKADRFVIATREAGFIIYDPKKESYEVVDQTNSRLNFPYVRSIFVDSENKYWVGHHYGLQIFNPEAREFKKLLVPEPNNGVVSIVQSGDRIFTGTDRQGILVYDIRGNLIRQFLEYGTNIPRIILLNSKELIFVSYMSGLFIFNVDEMTARKVNFPGLEKYPGIDFSVTALKDKDGKVWLGTYNYGLYQLDLSRPEVRNFSIREGLPSSDVVGIEEDDNDNVWLSTSFGLAKLDKRNFNIKTYFFNEGVNNYQFHEKASFKDSNGIIYFGGNSGLTYFNPEEIQVKLSNRPFLVLEDLYIHNKVVKPSVGKSILRQSLPYTKEITLRHRDQLFSISFAAFDFLSPDKMQYYYMLDGFDKDWYSIGNQRRASYSNLPRGKYTFRVKSVGSGGILSENEAQLLIRVKPAPWFSYLALSFYVFVAAGILLFIFRLRLKAFIYKKNLEMEHSEHVREREVNQMKQKFFANISHELRTPLTLIFGLVSQLASQDNLTPRVREFARSLDMNVSRLLKLINQLLAYRKLESDTLSLWLEKGNINEAIRHNVELFQVYSKEKQIRIEFQEDNNYQIWFDNDKLEKIMSNLLSNAIKHTREGGRIIVAVSKITGSRVRQLYKSGLDEMESSYIEISVSDTGHGIEEKDWDTIFDRYKQVENDGRVLPDYSGTGIGLNFTKSLVELHKGLIRMESRVGQGTTFAFVIPCDCSVFHNDDFASGQEEVDSAIKEIRHEEYETQGTYALNIDCDPEKTVLLIEDDPQLNSFLVNLLSEYYKVITAHDGEKGLKLVRQEHPDLVISDIMMPKKDGYELTRMIKENRELCHIPVILLTAKSEITSQIEGMQSGADLYIAKPFHVDFLLSAIDSQLKNRKRIHDIFLNGQMPSLERSDINHLDIQFLSKLNILLEKELSNPDLDIQLLAQNLNLSRSVFYRKFMSLTKLSPVAYIRKFRINKSIELMRSGKYPLAEIGELTGFRSPSYFSTAFKQEKGMGPREYLNQEKLQAREDLQKKD